MFGLGTQEIILVLVIVLVLFGGKKIPELLRGVGRGVGELQKGLHESRSAINRSIEEEPEPARRPSEKLDQEPEVGSRRANS